MQSLHLDELHIYFRVLQAGGDSGLTQSELRYEIELDTADNQQNREFKEYYTFLVESGCIKGDAEGVFTLSSRGRFLADLLATESIDRPGERGRITALVDKFWLDFSLEK